MVYAKPNTSTGAMKRSASALHDGAPGWDIAPPMMTPSRSSFHLPYAHYAMIYLDSEGKIKVDESSSIQEQNSTLFTPEVRQNFLEILGERVGFQSSARRNLDESPRRVRRRQGNALGTSVTDNRYDDGSDSDDHSPNGSTDMVPLRIGDSHKVTSYYEGALKHFQQLNCRMVAKAFIKFIEPRKQVRHPYNGGKPPAGSPPGATGDPEKTKPEWWPPGVMHKEPDHLRKEYRIELLLHIIRKLGGYGITADKLKEVAGDTKRSLKHANHVEIIYEILRVRKMEERLERGEVDANMVVFVQNRGPSPKGDGDEDDDSNDLLHVEAPEHIEDGLMTPTSAVEQVTAPLTTPIDTLPMNGGRSLPGSFAIPDPLGFDTSRQDRPYYTTPPHYTDSFSQPMLSTPVSAELISPHDVSVFDYSSQSSFPTSSPDQHRHTATGPYDSWGAPTFRQDIFSPVGYSTPPSSQTLHTPSMAYHLPMTAQLHEMSHHHAQSPMDSMGQRALPFRTGSLGHPNGMQLSHPA